jgi:hypothetical protein
MCMACEQDAMWFAYLESRGLLTPGDPAAAEALFADFPVQPVPMQSVSAQPLPIDGEASAPEPEKKNPFSCDDPTTG